MLSRSCSVLWLSTAILRQRRRHASDSRRKGSAFPNGSRRRTKRRRRQVSRRASREKKAEMERRLRTGQFIARCCEALLEVGRRCPQRAATCGNLSPARRGRKACQLFCQIRHCVVVEFDTLGEIDVEFLDAPDLVLDGDVTLVILALQFF